LRVRKNGKEIKGEGGSWADGQIQCETIAKGIPAQMHGAAM